MLTVALVLAGAFGGWKLVFTPNFQQLMGLKSERVESAKKGEVLKRIWTLETKIHSYQNLFSETRSTFWLIDALNEMADKADMTLVTVTPLEPETRKGYEKILVKLQMKGSYHALGKFFALVESHSRFIKIDGARIEKMAGPQEKMEGLQISILLSVFHPIKGARN
jgi:Tfp pilus assembly protein PilO